jgi:hypothetical protein
MKRSRLTLLVIVCLAVAVLDAPRCVAQSRGTFEFSPVVGANLPHSQLHRNTLCEWIESGFAGCSREANIGFALGGRVTAWLAKRLAIEGSLWHASATSFLHDDDVLAGHVRVLWRVIGGGSMWAYVVGGPAFVRQQTTTPAFVSQHTTSLAGAIGAGAHLRVAPGIAIRTEVEEYYHSSQWVDFPFPADPQWDLMMSLGLSFALKGPDR